jgi:hypothetical protein
MTKQEKISLIDECIKLDQENIQIMKKMRNQNDGFVKSNISASLESIKYMLKVRKEIHERHQ